MLPRAGAAAAAARPPLRMGIFSVTGGTVLESWVPKETGPLGKLPSILRPLEAHKNDVLIVSGLSQGGRCDGVNAHEHCAFKHLTAAEYVKREGGRVHAAVSVDQVAAASVGKDTLLPSLEIGMTNQETVYSFRGPNNPLPYEGDARLVFERMFRGRKPVVPNWQRRAANPVQVKAEQKSDSLEQSVLDLVNEQAKELRRNVSQSDQRKLDQYLESVRSVEKRVAFIDSRRQQDLLDLQSPGPSSLQLPKQMPEDARAAQRLRHLAYHDPDFHAEYIRIMADLMVLAFQTDTTRVVTMAAGSDDALFPGVVTIGNEFHCHTLEHQGNAGRPEDADPIAREALRQVHVWYTSLFAETLAKLKAIDEGGSSLLDNSMILYTSYMADGGHGQRDYPVLLAGNAGGTLKPGRHVAFPKRAPVANLYVEMLERMGAKVDAFGDSRTSTHAGSLNGRLPGLV
jgi:hypothetical protein